MIPVKSISDASFRAYGKVIEGYDLAELSAAMEKMPMPEGVAYEPSRPELENTGLFAEIRDQVYGGMPVQFGYCNGTNDKLNAVEYHRDSEINICVTDAIFLLGKEEDITDAFEYDTSKIEAFFAPAGTVVELFATALHYAPVGKQFRVCVVLPKGTNEPLRFTPNPVGESKLLTATNKWLIAHKDGGCGDAFVGLVGENVQVAL